MSVHVRRWPARTLGLLLAAASALGHAGTEEQIARVEGMNSRDGKGLDALTLEQVMQQLKVPGASIAVIEDSTIAWSKGYGVADADSRQPVDVHTRFQAASISKPVTAMAALRLAQDGRISLDADVNGLLRSWRVPDSAQRGSQPVTLRALLSHTSGSTDGFGFPGYEPHAPLPTLVQILKGESPSNTGAVQFGRAPFVAHQYSGGGLEIVQLALTDRLRQPFETLMQKLVLAPLGMSDSSFEPPADPQDARYSAAHDDQGKRMQARWHVYPEQAAAGLWTTPTDLARFIIEVQRGVRGPAGRVLKQVTAREMITPTGVGPFSVGLRIANRGSGWYFYHGGTNWGFECRAVGHFRKGYGVVVMTNAQGSGAALVEEMQARVAAVYGWDLLDKSN